MRRQHWLWRQARRWLRILLGVLLVLGGLFGFLPILGFWMVPLGVLVLAGEIPAIARLVKRLRRWWHARRTQGSQR